MPTTEQTEPIFDLDWANARTLHEGEWPDPGDDLDPVASIRVAHDSVVYAVRHLDRLEISEAMDDVRDAIKRLATPIRHLDGRPAEKAKWGQTSLQNVRTLLRDGDLEKAGDTLHEARDWLREALNALEGTAPEDTGTDSPSPASDGENAPDPTVELSDALIRPREELALLELAVMEAPNRGEEFADMLKWRLHDTRRKLEEAQERATERLQARGAGR